LIVTPEENLRHLFDEVFYLTEDRWPVGVTRLDAMPQFFELCRMMEVPFDFFKDSSGYPAWSRAPMALIHWVGGDAPVMDHRNDLLRNWYARYFGERQPLPAEAAKVVRAIIASRPKGRVEAIYQEYKQALFEAQLAPEARFRALVVRYYPEFHRWHAPELQPACLEEAVAMGKEVWRVAFRVNSVNDH
jgi:hypothetical protein